MSIHCTRLFRYSPLIVSSPKTVMLRPKPLPLRPYSPHRNVSTYKFRTYSHPDTKLYLKCSLFCIAFTSSVVIFKDREETEVIRLIEEEHLSLLNEHLDYESNSQENLWHLSAKISPSKAVWAFLKNHQCKGINKKNSQGQTPLLLAVKSCNPSSIRSLIECGASKEIIYYLDENECEELQLPKETPFVTITGYAKALLQKYTSTRKSLLNSEEFARQICCINRMRNLNKILKTLESC